MKVENNYNIGFEANIVHKRGAKKLILSQIEQYSQSVETINSDMFNQKTYVKNLMNNKPFVAKTFYNKLIKKFKENTKDFDFTIVMKKNKDKPNSIELKTKEGKVYEVAESRNHPLWIFASDLFRGENVLLTKATSLLEYNEKGSSMEQAFNTFWYNNIVAERLNR